MTSKSEAIRLAVKAAAEFDTAQSIALDERAWSAWENAWDLARDTDRAAGRRYSKERCAEAAAEARCAVYSEALNGLARAEGRQS